MPVPALPSRRCGGLHRVKILAVGDTYMPTDCFAEALEGLSARHHIEYLQIDPRRPFPAAGTPGPPVGEYQGSPQEIADNMAGVEVLLVHGAPVTAQVADASGVLALVGCARGGPVNVDVAALSARGIPLVTTPGKNAEAVADLTIAFLVMLARRMPAAQSFLGSGGQLKDNWDGARFMGNDLQGHVLGLVGFGQVGRRVARRASAFGMTVLVFDPFVDAGVAAVPDGPEHVSALDELLARSDFVSLHARATKENRHLIAAPALALMRPGSFLVNTARESLVDEDALEEALASGKLAGAALDVLEPYASGAPHRLLRHDNVVLTPHVGGATFETLRRGAQMLAGEVLRLESHEPLANVANREALVR
jgi:D-3-phosphoglycerate dehydrogenase